MEEKKSLSFGFSKKSTKKLVDSKATTGFDSTKEALEETDFVLEVNKSEIKGTKKKEVKKELVIPCQGNTYKVGAKIIKDDDQQNGIHDENKDLTPEELAAQELIKETKEWEENQNNGNASKNANLVIQSRENEKALFDADVESRPEISSQDDYNNIPVEGFGMALLRGMGFKKDEGIGGFRKANVECIDPVIRPKGLGLGATAKLKTKTTIDKNGKEEKLELKKGAHLRIESGPHKGQYGEVEGLDEETARIIVRTHGKVISISENIVQLVTRDEYKKFKNVINKEMYDEYSEKQKEREKEWNKRPIFDAMITDEDQPDVQKKKRKMKDTWVRRNLRVRIVDRKSKYYKEKVVVNDVISPERVEVVTNSGRVLDLDPYDLETVIPKSDFALIMIVKRSSEHLGKIAELLRKDPKKEQVAIRILPDKEIVLSLDYDDICELADDRDLY